MQRMHDKDDYYGGMMPIFPELIVLAMSYTPFQQWEQPLPEETALAVGSVFPSLIMPFMMAKGGEGYDAQYAAAYGCNGKG